MKLYPFQEKVLEDTNGQNKVAYYLDMGLGKTFVGAEKMHQLGAWTNLVICQKSKIDDWVEHFKHFYPFYNVRNLTNKKEFEEWQNVCSNRADVLIINYELAFRRPELSQLKDFTLMLDESSMIQNESAKRTEFIMKKLNPKNVILLSGTPTGGRYERLLSQIHLLGWNISEDLFYKHYIITHWEEDDEGYSHKVIDGYKNVDRLKNKLREHGSIFMKTDEVFDLPEQIFNKVKINTSKEYRKFKEDKIVTINEQELVGDTTLTKMLYERMLCGQFSKDKLQVLEDIIESTDDRLIVFYNFNEELRQIEDICLEHDKPMSIVNGETKDLSCYEQYSNSVAAIQYQAGSMGLNLQLANRIVYYTPTLSSELFEQSKKRIHRIGQNKRCFYYYLVCKGSIEEKIYSTLEMRKDYTEELFREEEDD